MQLPPVKNKYVNDDGNYCFCSDAWKCSIDMVIVLNQVHRQNDSSLIKVIIITIIIYYNNRTGTIL